MKPKSKFCYKAKKQFGQNFLIDNIVINKIVGLINPKHDQKIIEIGPGLGAITRLMICSCNDLKIIEIDRDLYAKLLTMFAAEISQGKLEVLNQDVLKVDFSLFNKSNSLSNLRIVGNLPYNISTPLLFKLFAYSAFVQDLHFLLQKEVAERLIASPGSKRYGKLSVMAQYHANISIMFYVNAKSFNPVPKVESCMVRFIPYKNLPYVASNYSKFDQIVNAAFCHRRKIIANGLKDYCGSVELQSLGINPMVRPEELSLQDFVKIANYFA